MSVARRLGYHSNTFRTFPAIIKRGSSAFEVRTSTTPVACRADTVDLAFVLSSDGTSSDWDPGEIAEDGLIRRGVSSGKTTKWIFSEFPVTGLAQETGSRLAKNMIVLGATCWLTGIPIDVVADEVTKLFSAKGPKVMETNLRAVELGFQRISSYVDLDRRRVAIPARQNSDANATNTMLMTGNDAISPGALVGGCRFFAGYPITPATPVLEWMAKHLPKFGGHVVQTEDEIAALCMVIGDNYAGIRGMTATSGPGISLMTESFGLAGMTETPVVVVDVQRPGPSAGQPTKHEQGDIHHVVYAGHGDIPGIVITPGTVQDCFHNGWMAFNLADRFQCPVFVLYDQDLSLRKQTIPPITLGDVYIDRGEVLGELQVSSLGESYHRYRDTPSGISPRAWPGVRGGIHVTSGDEHRFDGTIDVLDRSTRV
ncbi:2-oxoacid:acceptor oxidoreductase family protein [Alicyclobacillus cycloheptanicus]|uniref:2-oxoacid:acceptor oxidoreductase family protein n=1 Tax=Alicyclobacillus cycloheptanicus TaxID=1457 RepID=UPI0023796423|nr:2-oxoacid:acceptor oxidoreductase family protein [Alicyclobacillus cycloheptanicus]WDM00153.1 2-oxoacid:acceptor oxidoreductase family protein [Alicyclobacillus cycloheptanicus]